MTQWAKGLPHKCEERRLHLQNLCEARSVNMSVITVFLQQDGRQKHENLWELEVNYPYTRKPVLNRTEDKMDALGPLTSTCMPWPTHTHTHTTNTPV